MRKSFSPWITSIGVFHAVTWLTGFHFSILGRVFVIGAAMLPLVEPQLLGLIGHGAGIEDAGVADEALEPVRPVARDPVHHVAAIGAAERAGIGGVDPRNFAAVAARPFFMSSNGLPPQSLLIAVGEGLAVAGRPMEIDEHRRRTRAEAMTAGFQR